MNTSIAQKGWGSTALGAGLALGTIVGTIGGITGCARQAQESYKPSESEKVAAAAAGAEMQKSQLMSQSDYVKIRNLGHQMMQTHQISDTDLDWTLNLLRSADNAIARTRAMTVLSMITPMSAPQKAKILPAIAPFLNSTNELDQKSARRVQIAAEKGS